MSYLPDRPVTPIPMTVGQTIHLAECDGTVNAWTVQAVTANFVAATRPVTDRDRAEVYGEYEHDCGYDRDEDDCDFLLCGSEPPDLDRWHTWYTVLDWRHGVRGPCDLIGQGWGDGSYSEAECAQMLAEFESGDLEVSSRNWTRLDMRESAPA